MNECRTYISLMPGLVEVLVDKHYRKAAFNESVNNGTQGDPSNSRA